MNKKTILTYKNKSITIHRDGPTVMIGERINPTGRKKLQEELVLTVPGTGFGMPGYFRISYCVESSVIENSLPGFKRAIESV